MKKFFLALGGFVFSLVVSGQVFAVNYLCIQNSSSVDLAGVVMQPDGQVISVNDNNITQDTVGGKTMPAHSGNNWSAYCVGTVAASADTVLHVFLSNQAHGVKFFIDWENPWIGSPKLIGAGIDPTISNNLIAQYIEPGGSRYVVQICDVNSDGPGMSCVDGQN